MAPGRKPSSPARNLDSQRADVQRAAASEAFEPMAPRLAGTTASFGVTDHVSGAANGMQQRQCESLVDLGSQARNVHVDDIGLRVEMIVPDVLQQHSAGH